MAKLATARVALTNLGADGAAALAVLPTLPGQLPVAGGRRPEAAGRGRRGAAACPAHGPSSVGWQNTDWPGDAKVEAAEKRALKYHAECELPATIKVLQQSHVSGGFWLQLPAQFCQCMPDTRAQTQPQVMFDLIGHNGDGLKEEVPDGDTWEVIWLPKGQGGGELSGGWRGFSIDNDLAVGDTIVFEKLEGSKLQCTIFRAIPLAENRAYMAKSTAAVAKRAEAVAASKANGQKRRYAKITPRENAYRNSVATGMPYRQALAEKKARAQQAPTQARPNKAEPGSRGGRGKHPRVAAGGRPRAAGAAADAHAGRARVALGVKVILTPPCIFH